MRLVLRRVVLQRDGAHQPDGLLLLGDQDADHAAADGTGSSAARLRLGRRYPRRPRGAAGRLAGPRLRAGGLSGSERRATLAWLPGRPAGPVSLLWSTTPCCALSVRRRPYVWEGLDRAERHPGCYFVGSARAAKGRRAASKLCVLHPATFVLRPASVYNSL